LQLMSEQGIPVILIDRIIDGTALDVVTSDNEADYTPFLPTCRYSASQDAKGIGRMAAKRIL